MKYLEVFANERGDLEFWSMTPNPGAAEAHGEWCGRVWANFDILFRQIVRNEIPSARIEIESVRVSERQA